MSNGMIQLADFPNVFKWNLEQGYEDGPTGKYPKFLIRAYFLLATYKRDFEYPCSGFDEGFKVILTTPGDTIKLSKNALRISFDYESRILITPKLFNTSEKLHNYAPNQRQCFYQSERKLFFYTSYTQANCEEECLANFTHIECECVKFSMSRTIGQKICGAAKINCYKEAARTFFSNSISNSNTFRNRCNCLPSCTWIEYNAVVERIKEDTLDSNLNNGLYDDGKRSVYLFFTFTNQEIGTVKRIEVYTFTGFLAYCGGLLGLFLGISSLSIVELVYYSTLHSYWLIRRARITPVNSSDTVTLPHNQRTEEVILVEEVND